MKKILSLFIFLPLIVSAHQPRIVSEKETIVLDPEISKAYYGQLLGESTSFKINSEKSFDLYINILVPDIEKQKKDISVAIIKNYDKEKPLTVLDGINFEWKKFHEKFANDIYWMGPEYKEMVEAGTYEIVVWSSNNDSKYALAIGKKENFNFKEITNALTLIPQLKSNFFEKNPIDFTFSIFGSIYLIILLITSFIFSFIIKVIQKQINKTEKKQSIKRKILTITFGLIILLITISTTWNPILIIIAGLIIFKGIF